MMRTVGMIEVTGVDLAALVRAAYAPSRQQGLGHLDTNGRSSGLSDEVVSEILERGRADRMNAFSIDYLNGRSVKFHVRKSGDRLFILNSWYDHSDAELVSLLEQVGLAGDLITKAREEEAAHKSRVKDAAIAYLKERGGQFRENRGMRSMPTEAETLPEDIAEGIYLAKYDGLVTETHGNDGCSLWKLAEPSPPVERG
jgi:hypothetical protein